MIQLTLEKLRQLTQVDVQCSWYYTCEDLPPKAIDLETLQRVSPANDQRYIVWAKGNKVQWLAQNFTIPHHLQEYPLQGFSLRLILTWWAGDAQLFINGELVQQGDLYDSSTRLLLHPFVTPGQEISVALRLVSPGHDIGALMCSKLVYERAEHGAIDPGFVADELTILSHYLEVFQPDKLTVFETLLRGIDWDHVSDREKFDLSLFKLREELQTLATEIQLKQRHFHLLGHAHLDMAWLWPVNETWLVAQNTFTSVLNLQQDFPDLKYCHTSPVLYAWIEKHRPDLFKAIKKAVKAKSWEVVGGMWVEPEVNLISGESLVRQLLYGQHYFQEKFAEMAKVAWLPDSFGFTWQLPQIFKQGGIEYFVTGKLHWNDTTKFPYGVFWWQSPDGTQLLTLMSAPNLAGVMDTNPITMSNYAIDWEKQTGFKDIFWIPGIGDHGGGPTRDMLMVAKRWQNSPFFPQIQFTTAQDYLSLVKSQESNVEAQGLHTAENQESETETMKNFPVWKDELYLEFHRGSYTTHADQKAYNRNSENLLYQAELWSSLASIIIPNLPYPKSQLQSAWKQVLFNQFHDILPGTSIPEVFTEANQQWQAAINNTEAIQNQALQAIASQIILPGPPHPEAKPLIIFNALNWKCSQVVSIAVNGQNYQIYDHQNNPILCQSSPDDQLLFLAEDIPSVGYRFYWLSPNISQEIISSSSLQKGDDLKEDVISPPSRQNEANMENEYLRVIINHKTGNIASIYHKILQKELLSDEGNILQAYQDKGQYWDAWNIDPNYAEYPLSATELKSIEYLEKGPIQWRMKVIRTFNQSEFIQDYILQINSELLKIVTIVNWQETHVLVKAIFPLNLESDQVNYEIPCATISRCTRPQTKAEKAKWEVPALRWGDITDNSGEYGVSLLNNNKYGYSSQPNQLNLTLLRSSVWPDANADQGIHNFTYAIYAHGGTWQRAKTVHQGYELNHPLQVTYPEITQVNANLPPMGEFLNLSADNLILMAFKLAENDPKTFILRCYEAYGKEAELSLTSDLSLMIGQQVNLLENPLEKESLILPWKIVTFQITCDNYS
jgi:alpha-mannosidase